MTTLTVTKAQLAFTFWTFNQNPFIFKMPFCRFKGDFGIDEDEEQMISGQLRQLHLIIVWFGLVLLPWRKDFVLRKATLNLRMEILSSFETMFDSKGRMEARWSNSPLKRCLVEPDMVMI